MDYVVVKSCSFTCVKRYVNGLVCTFSVMFSKASEEVGAILKSSSKTCSSSHTAAVCSNSLNVVLFNHLSTWRVKYEYIDELNQVK
jgi:hypothetical protein